MKKKIISKCSLLFLISFLLCLTSCFVMPEDKGAESKSMASIFGGGFYGKDSKSTLKDDVTNVKNTGSKKWNVNTMFGARFEKHAFKPERIFNYGFGAELIKFDITKKEVSDSRLFLGMPYTVQLDKIDYQIIGIGANAFLDINAKSSFLPYIGVGCDVLSAEIHDKKSYQQTSQAVNILSDDAFGWGFGWNLLGGTRYLVSDKIFLLFEIQYRHAFINEIHFFSNDLSLTPVYSWRNVCLGAGIRF